MKGFLVFILIILSLDDVLHTLPTLGGPALPTISDGIKLSGFGPQTITNAAAAAKNGLDSLLELAANLEQQAEDLKKRADAMPAAGVKLAGGVRDIQDASSAQDADAVRKDAASIHNNAEALREKVRQLQQQLGAR